MHDVKKLPLTEAIIFQGGAFAVTYEDSLLPEIRRRRWNSTKNRWPLTLLTINGMLGLNQTSTPILLGTGW
jgi:hypothetical protein